MNIALWGTGNMGKYIEGQIRKNKNYFIKYFVDKNPSLWGKQVDGVEIISPENLQKCFSKELDFVLVAFTRAVSIYNQLLDMKINRFGFITDKVFTDQLNLENDLFQDKNILWHGATDRPLMRSLETNIVDGCNLNCRGCSHFSNLFDRDAKIPFDTFCKDLKQISEHVILRQLDMLGGEPILNDRIIEYFDFARKIFPDSEIKLITNGLLIPQQSTNFFRSCIDNNIHIIITVYKPTLALMDKISGKLEKNEVSYSFRWTKEKFGKNIDLTGSADKDKAVKSCRESKCHFLREGKIFKCPFEALGNKLFEHYGVPIKFQGGIDIYDKNLDWNKMLNDLYYNSIDSCKYCGEEEKMEWSATNAPTLDDWVVKGR